MDVPENCWQFERIVLELCRGDITHQTVDAIVNAANSKLAGGGGVDGAIHRAGGPQIMAETRQKFPNGCATGSAVISHAGKLNAQWVIHAVGPIWQGGGLGEREALANAYQSSLKLAAEYQCPSIAFPAISCGVYRFPMEEASHIALHSVKEFSRNATASMRVRFVLFDEETLHCFIRSAGNLFDMNLE